MAGGFDEKNVRLSRKRSHRRVDQSFLSKLDGLAGDHLSRRISAVEQAHLTQRTFERCDQDGNLVWSERGVLQ